jgi:hypothetical protein
MDCTEGSVIISSNISHVLNIVFSIPLNRRRLDRRPAVSTRTRTRHAICGHVLMRQSLVLAFRGDHLTMSLQVQGLYGVERNAKCRI